MPNFWGGKTKAELEAEEKAKLTQLDAPKRTLLESEKVRMQKASQLAAASKALKMLEIRQNVCDEGYDGQRPMVVNAQLFQQYRPKGDQAVPAYDEATGKRTEDKAKFDPSFAVHDEIRNLGM